MNNQSRKIFTSAAVALFAASTLLCGCEDEVDSPGDAIEQSGDSIERLGDDIDDSLR